MRGRTGRYAIRNLPLVRTSIILLIFSGLLTAAPLHAQDACGFDFSLDDADDSGETVVDYEGFAEGDGKSGNILTENISMSAQSASFDTENQRILVEGDVEILNNQARVTGQRAEYSAKEGSFRLEDSTFEFKQIRARGHAEEVYLSQQGVARLNRVLYTTCPEDKEDWSLTAKEIELDINRGVASTRSAALRFKNVPILYLPRASYPISDQRKSGFLIPELKTSSQRGLEIATPWYWNISPNKDATFTPRYMAKRGLMLGAEGRIKTQRSMNAVGGDYIHEDDVTKTTRYQWDIDSKTYWTPDWRMTVDATGVSDDRYLNDYYNRQSTSSRTALNQSLAFEHYGEVWSVLARFQGFQTVDEFIAEDDKPYTRLPQLAATGNWRDSFLGADYKLITEATYFYKKDEVDGLRVHLEPEISYPLTYNGLYLTPKVSLFHTSYKLDDEAPGQDSSPTVTAGIYSIDSGAVFERYSSNSNMAITLEPRIQYVYVPVEQQDDLPVFDTILPDSTLVQLFRPNRYLRYDRVGDANLMNFGLTSRFLSPASGRQMLTATLGHTRYFEAQQVTLPDETPQTNKSGDYLLQMGVDLYDSWNFDAGYQWSDALSKTSQANARLQLKVWQDSVLNLGYRYKRDSFDQGDLSFVLPVNTRWNVLARFNYSFDDREFLDQFAGVEYENCCWGVRLLGRRRVSRDLGESDNSVGIQFILKGFTEIGNSVKSTFERGILGYGDT